MDKRSAVYLLTLALTLSFVACAPPRRATHGGTATYPSAESSAPPKPTMVDQDYYLTVTKKGWKNGAPCSQHELHPKDLVLSVQTTVADPGVIDLITDADNPLLPTFEGVRLNSLTGEVDETWGTKQSFTYQQSVNGAVTPERVKLAYTTTTTYSSGLTCHYETTVTGVPRRLQDLASLDAVYTADYYRYARSELPEFNCPWFVGQPHPASEAYRLDIYDRGDGTIRLVIDHGEFECTLDHLPRENNNLWVVPATRGRLWDPFDHGTAWVRGTLGPTGVDLSIKYIPAVFTFVVDPENPPDPEAPRCWFDYHIQSGPKRLFNPNEVDNYYRVRAEVWDQCNTWQTEPPRVVTEEVWDIMKSPTGGEFKLLDHFGFVSTLPLFTGNSFQQKETVVYDDGTPQGVTVTWSSHGSFDSPLIEETTYGAYPRACIVKTYAFGHARFSF